MKKIILSAAMALFVVTAFAQTKTQVKTDVSASAKSNTNKDKQKSAEVSGTAKSDVEFKTDDLNRDGKMSKDEKAARKARKDANKAERSDESRMDQSGSEKNAHGKAVSEIATETTLEGREKGAAISGVAKSNSELKGEGILSSDDKSARREARKEEAKTRRSDRADDGLLNGSVENEVDGKVAGGVSLGKGNKGKAKGGDISTGAKSKTRVKTGVDVSAGKKVRVGL
ncbi:hypothetical protein [Daejeonella sp.]|uniref:hypothetical protein n=1 Tax=Daejeonella sp. TaxID=2805397 RepID=UPI0030BDED44